jgi:nucleotide-binding universal stress UspA family protein
MRKILFPFELDHPIYKEAYIYGIKFARKISAELIVLNVFKVEVGNDITEEKYGALKKDNWFKAYNEICKFNRYYLEDHARTETDLKIRFNYRFVNGILMDEIKSIAREDEVDLIVLPISDQREFNKRQLKIIRDNIFEKNRTSLLVVPFGCVYRPIQNMVFATDLKKLSNYKQYIHDVINYARLFDSNIHFIHVSSREKAEDLSKSDTYNMVMQAIEKNKRHTFKSLHGKQVIESLNQYVEQNHADMLVVVKHQHHFMESIVHDSLSVAMSLHSKVPVLVMREKRLPQ